MKLFFRRLALLGLFPSLFVFLGEASATPTDIMDAKDPLMASDLCTLSARPARPPAVAVLDQAIGIEIGKDPRQYATAHDADINGRPDQQYHLGIASAVRAFREDGAATQACKLFQRAAGHGLNAAYAMLGEMLHADKSGTEKSNAMKMAFQRAAAQDHPLARLRLAEADLERQPSASKDANDSIQTIRSLAQSGFIPAQVSLGELSLSRGDVQDARTWLGVAASSGEPQAQYQLGTLLLYGASGLSSDLNQARGLLLNAGKAGYRDAYIMLADVYWNVDASTALATLLAAQDTGADVAGRIGAIYFYGGGNLPPNPAKGLSLLKAASSKGDSHAMLTLGGLYRDGTGVPADLGTAIKYFSDAARLGDMDANIELAWHLAIGKGITRDLEKAYHILDDAVAKKYRRAFLVRGLLEMQGSVSRLSRERAANWYRKGAQWGNWQCAYNLALLAFEPNGLSMMTPMQAVDVLRRLADGGMRDAMTTIGSLYLHGRIVQRDEKLAYGYILKASDLQVPYAQYLHGYILRYGLAGQARNPTAAFRLMTQSLKDPDVEASFHIALLYLEGFGTARNIKEARVWFEQSRKMGSREATRELAKIIETGADGSAPDAKLAQSYWKEAAAAHDYEAEITLRDRAQQTEIARQTATNQAAVPMADWRQESAEQLALRKETREILDIRDDTPKEWTELNLPAPDLTMRANNGDAAAQNELGYRYLMGHGLLINRTQAFHWLNLSALQGNPRALANMAMIYSHGLGTMPDAEAALVFCTLSIKYDQNVLEPDRHRRIESWCRSIRETLPAKIVASADLRIATFKPKPR